MRDVLTVYRKELRTYLVSPIPYVFLIIFTTLMAWMLFYMGDGAFFVRGRATLQGGFFDMLPMILLFFVPAISMRLWSEEVRTGTLEQLMTMPVRTHALVAGKFLSAWTLLLVALVMTLPLAFTVSSLGDLDWGPVLGGYFGALLYGGALLSLGVWISALTGHQIVAFLVTLVCGFILFVLQWVAGDTMGATADILSQLSLTTHYRSMGRGVIDLRDLLYFASVMALFLYLNVQTVENRRIR